MARERFSLVFRDRPRPRAGHHARALKKPPVDPAKKRTARGGRSCPDASLGVRELGFDVEAGAAVEAALQRLLSHGDTGRGSGADPCRPGNALRRIFPPILAAGRHGGDVGRRPAGRLAHSGRGPGAVPRPRRPARPAPPPLQPPRGLAGVRDRGGAGHPLLLSRLALRHRRHDPGHAGRAGRQQDQGPRLPRRLPGLRARGPRLRLPGPARREAPVPHLRYLRPAEQPAHRLFDLAPLQLASDSREHGGSDPRRVPAHARGRHAVDRGLGRDAGGRVPGNRQGHDLRLRQALRQQYLGPIQSRPLSQLRPDRRAVGGRRRGEILFARLDHALDGPDRRSPLPGLRLAPFQRRGRPRGPGRRDPGRA